MQNKHFFSLIILLVFMQVGIFTAKSQVVKPLKTSVPISASEVDAAEPVIITAQDKSFYVAWVEHFENGEADLMFAHLDEKGTQLITPVRVNPKNGEVKAWRGDPLTLAISPNGDILIGWTGKVEESKKDNQLYLSISKNQGQSFLPPAKVNDNIKASRHALHSIAVDESGRIYFAWLDNRDISPPQESKENSHHHIEPNSDVYVAYTDDGKSFSVNQRLAREVCPCCKTSIISRNGQVYVGWRQVLPDNYRHIAIAASKNRGKSFSASVIVSDDQWKLSGCPVTGPKLAINSKNKLAVTWFSDGKVGKAGIYFAFSQDGGKSFSPRKLLGLAKKPAVLSIIASEKTGFEVVWDFTKSNGQCALIKTKHINNRVVKSFKTIALGEPYAISSDFSSQLLIRKQNNKRSVWFTF